MTAAQLVLPVAGWREQAEAELHRLARTCQPFTVDDLYQAVGHPDRWHQANGGNNQVGALFVAAKKQGRIEVVGFRPARTEHRRGGIVRIWRGIQ
jgi:hypothetical protein